MPKKIDQYRVFIATPSGLDDERKSFRKTLEDYTASDAEPRGITFHPVGWEDTLGGIGRPQELINENLRQCDYAVFVWHDCWGSPTGNRTMVGTEEEWNLAEELYKTGQVRNIVVFFKNVDERQLRDPGEQLKQVLAHKKRIEEEKRYLFKSYDQMGTLCDELRKHLAAWLRDHEKGASGTAIAGGDGSMAATEGPDVTTFSLAVGSGLTTADAPTIAPSAPPLAVSNARPPNFRFWIEEIKRLLEAGAAETETNADALFCARKALALSASDLERAEAKYALGICQDRLNKPADALATFSEIATELDSASDTDRRFWQAAALAAKAGTLVQLGRKKDAIAVFDDVISRFGAKDELALRGPVVMALVNKGVCLEQPGRNEEAIAIYDDVIARFGGSDELALREQIAGALVNKGVCLEQLGRNEEAIAVYDDVIARFGAARELALRERVAAALINKGAALGKLGRDDDGIAVYDDVVARFSAASELALRERVAMALVNKGVTLGRLGRAEGEIFVYDDVIARFGAAKLALRQQVASALGNKGAALDELGRVEDEIAVYDDVVARFGTASELALREQVARALVNKGIILRQISRNEEALSAYDDVIHRFGIAGESALRDQVLRAFANKFITVGERGRSEEEISIFFDKVIARLGVDKQPYFKALVEAARITRRPHGSSTESQ